jgi:effector-binding domain-containing protein
MLDTPRITTAAAQRTASIRFTIPMSEMRNVVGPGIGEVMAAVAAQGIARTGPWFIHVMKMERDTIDFEIGVPVTAPVAAAGRVEPGQLPAAIVARAVYSGPYDGLPAAWRKFDAWIAANGHTPAQDLWDSYVTGPESNPDPATWRTELNRPLLG